MDGSLLCPHPPTFYRNFKSSRLLLIFMLLDTWADPLQHVVAEVFVLLLHGLVKLYKEVEASGQSLYEKYKNMREGSQPFFGISKFGRYLFG